MDEATREQIAHHQGWNDALVAATRAIRQAPSLDENGYICQKSDAIAAVKALRDAMRR
jgi:hypothetical protein